MVKNIRDRIEKEIRKSKSLLAKLVSELIQFNTENPPVNDNSIQYFIKEKLEEYGAVVKIHSMKHKATPLTSTLGKSDKDNFILYGHGDVVPAGDLKRWKYPPFSGKIVGSKAFGRGAADMKGGLAAEMLVFSLLTHYEAQDHLRNGISFVSPLDEENWFQTPKGWNTSEWLLETGKLKGRACIMGEQSSISRVIVGERGDYWAKLSCLKRPRHGSAPVFEENPNIIITDVLRDINSKIKETITSPPEEAKELLEGSYEFIEKDLNKSESEGMRNEVKRMMTTPSLNVGILQGGTMINLVPDHSEAMLAFCLPVGMKANQLHKIVSKVVSKYKSEGVILEPIGNAQADPTYTLPTSPLVKSIRVAAKRVIQKNVPVYITQATSDANLFRSHGIDTCFYGPGEFNMSHTYNEWVDIDDVTKIAELYADAIFDYDKGAK